MPDFSIRSNEEEIMDGLSMTGEELGRTLDQIAHINRWLGGDKVIVSGVKEAVANMALPPDRPLVPSWSMGIAVDCWTVAPMSFLMAAR